MFPISTLSTGLLPKILLPRLGSEAHVAQVIGTEVPASPEGRQRQEGAAGDRRTDLRRQALGRTFGFLSEPVGKRRRKSRSSSSATRSESISVRKGKAGRKSGRPKKGRGTSGGFGPDFRSSDRGSGARPGRSKDQRAFGRRSRVDGPGSSQEGAAGWKATPELVSQDREAGSNPSRGETKASEHRQILRSAQWGLAAMPAPISYVRAALTPMRRLSY